MNQEGLRRFTELMSERVIGQRFALSRIKDALPGASRQPGTPLATLLFVGGTGLGKTTTARTMARVLFGSEAAYREIQTDERIGPEIIKALSEQPGVAFLRNASEENERVRSELASVLRQFKSGGTADGEAGGIIDFRDSIFIVSLKADLPFDLTLQGNDESKDLLRGWLQRRFKGTFAEEFFQSFDAIIPFRQFDVATKVHLAELKISEMAKRQITSGRTLMADNSVAAYVGSRARDELGALDVQRAFDEYVSRLLNETVSEYEGAGKRATRIRMSVVDAEIRISVE